MGSESKHMKSERIIVATLGRTLDKSQSDTYLINQLGAVKYRDAYYLKLPEGEAWLFDYAILVCWGVSEDDRQNLISSVSVIIVDPEKNMVNEQFSYSIDCEAAFNIHNDFISVPVDNNLTRLALSHAFAQSAKLVAIEEQAEAVLIKNSFISKELARTGRIPLNRKALAKLRGQIFDTSSDIGLHFNLLDTPEFFWNYPDQEEYYLRLCKYLDLQPRIDILNHKLANIHELLNMLAAEQHHKHSAFLEWIIIVLIAVDIIVYFTPK